MKKLFFFFLAALAISFSACVNEDEPATGYKLELNGVKYSDGDTVKCITGQNFRAAFLENGVATSANFSFGNGASDVTGYQAFVTYDRSGNYTLRAEKGTAVIRVYVKVGAVSIYTLKIDNKTVGNDSTYKALAGTKLGFKVIDETGKKVNAYFDFGNDQKVTTDSVAVAYTKGNYILRATVGGTTIKANLVISEKENVGEAIILISSSVSSTTINAVIGLRCDAINGFDLAKDVYVAGEIPGVNWRDYSIGHQVTLVDGISYFKWDITAVAGNFRLSWIQLKSGKTDYNYNNCTWAYYPSSKYWNNEGLFRFTTYIENGVAKIKQ